MLEGYNERADHHDLHHKPRHERAIALAALSKEIDAAATLSWVSLGLAAGAGLVALLRPSADLTDEEILSGNISPSGMRWLGGALSLLVPLVWAAALLAVDPSVSAAGSN